MVVHELWFICFLIISDLTLPAPRYTPTGRLDNPQSRWSNMHWEMSDAGDVPEDIWSMKTNSTMEAKIRPEARSRLARTRRKSTDGCTEDMAWAVHQHLYQLYFYNGSQSCRSSCYRPLGLQTFLTPKMSSVNECNFHRNQLSVGWQTPPVIQYALIWPTYRMTAISTETSNLLDKLHIRYR